MAKSISEPDWELIDKIPGWLTRGEAECIYGLCTGKWCEVGSWKGRSAAVLGSTGSEGYCVDWFSEGNSPGEFLLNAGRSNVHLIQGKYQDVVNEVPGNLHLLYLDADHTYHDTKEVWELYTPKVEYGCYVALHDTWPHPNSTEALCPGVTKFVIELIQGNEEFDLVMNVERIAVFKKHEAT